MMAALGIMPTERSSRRDQLKSPDLYCDIMSHVIANITFRLVYNS